LIAFVAVLFAGSEAVAQNRRVSQLEVRITYTGFRSLYGNGLNGTCPGVYRGGTDVVEGLVQTVGSGDALDGEEVVYQGVLKRRTHLGICDLQMRNGHEDENDWCAFLLSGTKDVEVSISVGAQQGEGTRVLMTPVPGSISVAVTGGCDEARSDWRADYLKSDEANFYTVPPGRLRVGRYREYGEGMSGSPQGEWLFEVVREADDLEAVLQAGSAVRGEKAVLDASKSLGQIKTYTWTLEPQGSSGAPVTKFETQTPRVELVLLENVQVTLEVGDGRKKSKPAIETAKVVPRKWRTDYKLLEKEGTMSAGHLIAPINKCGYLPRNHFGQTTCAIEGQDAGHAIHSNKPNTWWDDGYTLGQVKDPGRPFNGFWYLTQNRLFVKLQILLNADLQKGSPLYDENRKQGPLADFETLVASTRAHENRHARLIQEALLEDDPAKRIEALVKRDKDNLVTMADMEIRSTETEIKKDDFHEKEVRSFLRTIKNKAGRSLYSSGGLVWLRDGCGGFDKWAVPSFADKGD